MKLCEMQIKNFGCIDNEGLKIKIDNIVVLIGANNVGKSTVLEAYEAFQSGSALNGSCFHNCVCDNPIEILGVFSELNEHDVTQIGSKWNFLHPEFGDAIQYKWVWRTPDEKGEKHSWNNDEKKWVAGGMGGWDTKIASCIPQPLKINPNDSPATLEKQIIEILTTAVKDAVKTDESKLSKMVEELNTLALEVHTAISDSLNQTTDKLEQNLNDVFPDYKVRIQPEAGKLEVDKIIAAGSHIRITDPMGTELPLDHQGTGLQRTFLWSAIESLADTEKLKIGKKALTMDTPRILLVEEPEAFLHPPAIRAAREALYKIAELPNWQVVITTHSPIFIDVSKEHTTIIRIDKNEKGVARTFSTDKANFDEDERKRLQMIRACNPTINEFFFTDKVLLVEGETEQAVFTCIKGHDSNLHILNCFGKANIPMFQKILNHFGVEYVVIHDSDSPKAMRDGKWINNAMWTINKKIFEIAQANTNVDNVVLVSVPDFEVQYFGYLQKGDKPYNAIMEIGSAKYQALEQYKDLCDIAKFQDVRECKYRVRKFENYQERVSIYSKDISEDKDKWTF